jgi:hypothetical protein
MGLPPHSRGHDCQAAEKLPCFFAHTKQAWHSQVCFFWYTKLHTVVGAT